jgi:hypothetical protein
MECNRAMRVASFAGASLVRPSAIRPAPTRPVVAPISAVARPVAAPVNAPAHSAAQPAVSQPSRTVELVFAGPQHGFTLLVRNGDQRQLHGRYVTEDEGIAARQKFKRDMRAMEILGTKTIAPTPKSAPTVKPEP